LESKLGGRDVLASEQFTCLIIPPRITDIIETLTLAPDHLGEFLTHIGKTSRNGIDLFGMN
jgi:hypothetical protein